MYLIRMRRTRVTSSCGLQVNGLRFSSVRVRLCHASCTAGGFQRCFPLMRSARHSRKRPVTSINPPLTARRHRRRSYLPTYSRSPVKYYNNNIIQVPVRITQHYYILYIAGCSSSIHARKTVVFDRSRSCAAADLARCIFTVRFARVLQRRPYCTTVAPLISAVNINMIIVIILCVYMVFVYQRFSTFSLIPRYPVPSSSFYRLKEIAFKYAAVLNLDHQASRWAWGRGEAYPKGKITKIKIIKCTRLVL